MSTVSHNNIANIYITESMSVGTLRNSFGYSQCSIIHCAASSRWHVAHLSTKIQLFCHQELILRIGRMSQRTHSRLSLGAPKQLNCEFEILLIIFEIVIPWKFSCIFYSGMNANLLSRQWALYLRLRLCGLFSLGLNGPRRILRRCRGSCILYLNW